MTKQDIVIIWLSLQITFMSVMWLKAEKQLSYLQGQQHIFDLQTESEEGH